MNKLFLREKIEEFLREILQLFLTKKITHEQVIDILNTAAYHTVYAQYLFEMFFIEALKINNVPNNKYLLIHLFSDLDPAAFTCPDQIFIKINPDSKKPEVNVLTAGTRLKVLDALRADKTRQMYIDWLTTVADAYDIPKEYLKKDFDKAKFFDLILDGHSESYLPSRIIKNSFLREKIEASVRDVLQTFLNKKITDEEVLTILKTATYHSTNHAHLFEMFFIEALKMNHVPNNKYLAIHLFFNLDINLFLCPDRAYSRWNHEVGSPESVEFGEGTRLKVLDALRAKKTTQLYKFWLMTFIDTDDLPEEYQNKDFHGREFRELMLEELQ